MLDYERVRRRVVITGVGAISALGSSVRQLWEGWMAGRSGVRKITQFDASQFPCQIAGEIPDFDVEKYMDRKEARRFPRSGQIALASAVEAGADASLGAMVPNPERGGVIFGTAMGGMELWEESLTTLKQLGFGRMNPFTLPFSVPNLSAFLIAKQFQCLGPNATITTACATGTQTVGEGCEIIRKGKADIMFVGGTEALVKDYAIGGFGAMRALPVNYNDRPEAASRPFDSKREGFVFSEGAGALVLEDLEHALKRGVRIYAEVIGQASSCDGYHIAVPEPEGSGAKRTMRWALEDAGIALNEVDYINAHGSSTPLNDMTETKAIKEVFGDHAYKLAVSSTKSMIGHAMGGTGALEAIACTLAIHHGWLPPTINYENPDPECDLDYVPNTARKMEVRVALSNSFGLGGQNACLILRKYTG
jgi:3-oxoacyl-[acyl-carrier-protein] synthase II